MSVQLKELLGLESTEFIDALLAMKSKLVLFQLTVQKIAQKKIQDLTMEELGIIPVHFEKVSRFKGVLSIFRDATTLKFNKMSDYQILKIDDILTEMKVVEEKLDGAAAQFVEWHRQRGRFWAEMGQ